MTTPAQLIKPEILAMSAYHVSPSAGMVKLDAMENPYPLPERLAQLLGERLGRAPINRYPDPHSAALKDRLREVLGIPAELGLLVGNGSDEIIQIVTLALAQPGATMLAFEPSFVMYQMVAAFCGMKYVGVPLNADFTLDLPRAEAAIREHRPALIFVAYPNNPTGNLFDRAGLERILDMAPGLVVSDEAYFPFNDESFLRSLGTRPNLVMMRTVSKLGLAGLRLGLLAGPSDWLGEFEKLRLPYNVNVLTQLAADLVLGEVEALREQAAAIRAERERLWPALAALAGVEAFPTAANFILFRVAQADRVFDGLKQRGILIKNLSHSHSLLANCLRTTVGTPQENERFLSALKETLA